MEDLNQEEKPVYPLFQKGAKGKSIEGFSSHSKTSINPPLGKNVSDEAVAVDSTLIPLPSLTIIPNDEAELLEVDPNKARRKRRKTESIGEENILEVDASAGASPSGQKKRSRVRTVLGKSTSVNNIEDLAGEEDSSNVGNKDSTFMAENGYTSGDDVVLKSAARSEPLDNVKPVSTENRSGRELPSELVSSRFTLDQTTTDISKSDPKPQKVLRLNPKTGTIGSPPAKKPPPSTETTVLKQAKGRKTPKSKVVTLHYGQDERLPVKGAIGLKINQVLKGIERIKTTTPKKLTSKISASTKDEPKPPKLLHPLFLGKAAAIFRNPSRRGKKDVVDLTEFDDIGNSCGSEASGRSITRASPGKPKPRFGDRPALPQVSSETLFPMIRNSVNILKVPGAVEPAWPWKGIVHIRGLDTEEDQDRLVLESSNLLSKSKKSKYQAVNLTAADNILEALASTMSIDSIMRSIKEINIDEFAPVAQCLRIPLKHNESGVAVQARIQKELRTRLFASKLIVESSSEDENPFSSNIHPAITNVYSSIASSLSAFDKGHCEIQTWCQKYSPKAAADVLQVGREALILKEWLQTLTVNAVESGPGAGSRRSSISKSAPIGKRKRKSKKLDGFVVSSDEEVEDLGELTEPGEDPSPRGKELSKKTVVRSVSNARDAMKISNTVVLSGPHGCGKTAAVYAVAKELGFEIFEINSSSRRSGKDILEKVGDMTRNHQVQRSSILSSFAQTAEQGDEDAQRIDDALANDLQSGRQGTMNSFFQPNQKTKEKPKAKKERTIAAQKPEATQAKLLSKTPPKDQKQSLILIEEADIVYKEDTNFWATIMNLIVTSKRPIIITCNDESAIPLESFAKHAILRLCPPSTDLAVDYMLVVAACEGHTLKHDAVRALYESRKMDLRASLTDLQFWCQFAVGDENRGLGWYHSRWPKGSDVDSHGNTIRVISEGTYKTGMGWFPHDFLLDHLDPEEEMLHAAHGAWNLDAGDWQQNLDSKDFPAMLDSLPPARSLQEYVEFSESMSVADFVCGSTFALENNILLDASAPRLSEKAKEDYILSHQILEAQPLVIYPPSDTHTSISLWLKLHALKRLKLRSVYRHGAASVPRMGAPEKQLISLVRKNATQRNQWLSRHDFSLAFDPISCTDKASSVWSGSAPLELSQFDCPFSIVTLDLAPYVRGIVRYDAKLQKERERMSGLLSQGGQPGKKRMRTTRAAMSALEGGKRTETRKERYFDKALNAEFVQRTGGNNWASND